VENLVYSLAIYFFHTGGGSVFTWPRPDKSFKINRVPVKANNCSGLASRTKKPGAMAGRF